MDPIEEIKGLYFKASKATIARDFARAIELLKALPDEAARERAAVYMNGLAQMRGEWEQPRSDRGGGRAGKASTPAGKARPAGKTAQARAAPRQNAKKTPIT